MGLLNQALASVREFFAGLTPSARLIAGLLVAAMGVASVFLVRDVWRGPQMYLINGENFTPEETQKALAAFADAGLEGYRLEGSRILVPTGSEASYIGAMAEANVLPAAFGDHWERAFSSKGMFGSQAEFQARVAVGKQQELSRLIRQNREVENAAVIFNAKQNGPFRRDFVETAVVTFTPARAEHVAPEVAGTFRRMVASAYSLPLDAVTVMDTNGFTYHLMEDDEGGGAGGYFARTKLWESRIEAQARELLEHSVPGAMVKASVVLKDVVEKTTNETRIDPETTTIQSKRSESTTTNERPISGGVVGLRGQQPAAANQAATAPDVAREQSEERESEKTGLASGSETITSYAGFYPENVSLAITVPRVRLVDEWRKAQERSGSPPAEDADPTEQDLTTIKSNFVQRIQGAVRPLLRAPPGQDPLDAVAIEFFDADPIAQYGTPYATPTWRRFLEDYGTALAAAAAAAVSLALVVLIARSAPSFDESRFAVDEVEDGDEDEEDEGPEGRSLSGFAKGQDLRSELAEIVKEDPDAALSVLQGWVAHIS